MPRHAKSALLGALAAVAAVLAVAGCADGTGDPVAPAPSATPELGTACVILPDTESSTRYVLHDAPALEAKFSEAGFDVNLANASGDADLYLTLGLDMLSAGCSVMVLDDYNGAAVPVAEAAADSGVPVIAYDRALDGADYYISYDNFAVGAMQADGIVDALRAEGKPVRGARVVLLGGDPGDPNSAAFRAGALSYFDAQGLEVVAEPEGSWERLPVERRLEAALDSLAEPPDAIWAANDTIAEVAIQVLAAKGITAPVSGQDATVAGLQAVLDGRQSMTVYKPAAGEAAGAVQVAVALLTGQELPPSRTLGDGTPYWALVPIPIGPGDIQQVIDAGDVAYAELCTAEFRAACDAAGLHSAA